MKEVLWKLLENLQEKYLLEDLGEDGRTKLLYVDLKEIGVNARKAKNY